MVMSPVFIRSGQNHLARHSERGVKTRQTEEEVGRQHQGMDRPGARQVPESSGEQGNMEETDCEIQRPSQLSDRSNEMREASLQCYRTSCCKTVITKWLHYPNFLSTEFCCS